MGERRSLYKVSVVKPEEKIVKILCTCQSHEAILGGRDTADVILDFPNIWK
jgi:hypothetical protein